ncbi:MAG: hypothetical protein ABL956_14415 [Hyphomonadaceae bacterium]
MRTFRAGFAALALATAFTSGCSQPVSGALKPLDVDAKSVEAFVTKLAGETFKGKTTTAADIAAVRDALPKEVGVTWGNLSFDAATNSTLLTDVKLTPKDTPQVGLGIQELRLFDFDANFAKARLSGQRLAETAALASRIDAKGVSLFGMAAMLNSTMGIEPTTEPVAPGEPAFPSNGATPDEPSPSDEPSFDESIFRTSFDKYDFSFSRVILNDIVLRPYEMTPAAAGSSMTQMYGSGGEFFQQYIAIMRAFGVDTFAAYDMKADLGMTQMGQKVSVSFAGKTTGTRGWRGGDFDASFIRDMSFSVDATESPLMQTPAMRLQYSIGNFGMEDLRFDKLYAHMAKGTMPARTETNLLSYGLYTMENQVLKVGGKDLMTVGESTLDARKFHWFIPTEIKASAKNAMLDIGAITQMSGAFAEEMAASFEDPSMPPPAGPDFAAIAAVMEKHGLAKPTMNFNFGWNWNAISGDSKIDLGFGGDKLMQVDTRYEGSFPSFKAVSDLIPEDPEQANLDKIGALFDEKSMLKLMDINVTDNGGLEKMFNLTADLGPIMAASDPSGFNPLEGQTGQSLRQMAGGMLTMLGATPDIAPFITPLSTFVTQGGKLHISFRPAQPMTWSAIGMSLMGPTTSPGEQLKQLGLKVDHGK